MIQATKQGTEVPFAIHFSPLSPLVAEIRDFPPSPLPRRAPFYPSFGFQRCRLEITVGRVNVQLRYCNAPDQAIVPHRALPNITPHSPLNE